MDTGESNQQSLPYPALGPPKNSCAPLFPCIELSPSLLRGDNPQTSHRSRLRIIRGCQSSPWASGVALPGGMGTW